MNRGIKKSDLVAELSTSTGVSKSKVNMLLNELSNIAYREARNGFIVPGLCKLKVVKRKASRYRNPATGKLMMLAERDVLKTTPLKKAKDTITPRPENFATEIKEDAPSVPKGIPNENVPAQDEHLPQGIMGDGNAGNIVFACGECGSMLSAELDKCGIATECPICGTATTVPSGEQTSGSISAGDGKVASEQPVQQTMTSVQDFVTFICQACGQEIEAPIDMVSMEAACPTCGSLIHIPEEGADEDESDKIEAPIENEMLQADKKAMTIRIDLSDLE